MGFDVVFFVKDFLGFDGEDYFSINVDECYVSILFGDEFVCIFQDVFLV